MKYIAKEDGWFDAGTECLLVYTGTDRNPFISGMGVFEGWRTCQNESEMKPLGSRYLDQEFCNLDEFDIIDEDKEP